MRAAGILLLCLGAVARAQEPAPPPPGLELLREELRTAPPLPWEALTRYSLDLALDDAQGQVEGRLLLDTRCPDGAPLQALPLRLDANAAAELAGGTPQLELLAAEDAEGRALTLEPVRPTLVRVRLAAPAPPGSRLRLRLRFRARLRQLPVDVNDPMSQALAGTGSLGGRGPSDYGLLARGDGLLTLAQPCPRVPPRRGASWDDGPPARVGDVAWNDPACFELRVVLPAGLRLVSNLRDAPARPGPTPGSELVCGAGAGVRDLVLVAGRDLERLERQVGPVRVSSVFRARDARAGALVLEVAVAALASFERRLGPYPWTELDLVEASLTGGAGGVEACGLALIAGMLYRPPSASQSPLALYLRALEGMERALEGGRPGAGPARSGEEGPLLAEALEFTVAHEVAHQWFAGLVGNDCRRDPTVDEPLAQWLAAQAWGDRHGGAVAARRALEQNARLNYAVYRLLGGRDRPARRATRAFADDLEYAGLVYGKAPFLYAALEQAWGAERLEAALRGAVARHRFQAVDTPGWLAALGDEAGAAEELTGLARRWLDEAHGDEDLGVDDSGDLVWDAMLGPGGARSVREGLASLGLDPRETLRSLLGGARAGQGGGEEGEPLDLEEALRALEGR